MTSVLYYKTDVVLSSESNAFSNIGRFGDIDCIVHIISKCTWHRLRRKRFAAIASVIWRHDRR